MIKIPQIFVLTAILLPCLPGRAANAADPASLPGIETAYTACVAALDTAARYAPLAAHGLLAPSTQYAQAQLTDPAFATPPESRLVAEFQAAEAVCEVNLRIDLMNVDAALSDLASQTRQQTDVNELLLIDGKENWGQFSSLRAQIDSSLQQASAAALAGPNPRIAGLAP